MSMFMAMMKEMTSLVVNLALISSSLMASSSTQNSISEKLSTLSRPQAEYSTAEFLFYDPSHSSPSKNGVT
ncbi:hypothetical protein CPB84DRAFT_1766726 [Gymnopilus junonius]|uniref:Uncharacterized protein n=1 Tax=Gymnopilus junonius TaxID=109634 RepID=A0A9P5TSB6_GYMJU|nr:hypothetical protein CPB84DRAFT_1766726 [Gymnopilus junonius]